VSLPADYLLDRRQPLPTEFADSIEPYLYTLTQFVTVSDVDNSDTSGRILDAAIEAAAVHGVARLSMSDVARRAGLSRPTLYRHFPSKQDLLGAALTRESLAIVGAVLEAVAPIDDPREAIETAVAVTLQLTRDHPLLDRIVRTEPETLVPVLVSDGFGGSPSILSLIRVPVQAVVTGKVPALDEVAARRLADVLTRLLVSYAVNAPDDPPDIVAASIASFLGPGLASRNDPLPTDESRPTEVPR
jgi:AcrR family transcriptional regulator